MTTHSSTARLNLEFYKKQAKSLLKSAESGDGVSLQRLQRHSPELQKSRPALHNAQLTIAREQGFPSWPAFHAFIEQSNLDFQQLVDKFIDAAVSDYAQAKTLLAANPKIAAAGFYVALVLGNAKSVELALNESPSLAKEKSGPQKCEPLLYTCFSRFANPQSPNSNGLVETARILLQHGADPNTASHEIPNNPLSCLYAASGLNNNPVLTELLLEAGANPNDNESLYHSTEHPDLASFKILLKHGASPNSTNVLKHMLDRQDFEGLELLLTAGANPNELNHRDETALHWAIWRNRSAKIISALLNAGVDINAKRKDGRTAYALSTISGQSEVAALLADRGADTTLSAIDSFVASAASPNSRNPSSAKTKRTFPDFTGNERLLPDLTISHNVAAVRALLAAGVPVNARGEHGATALHWACWHGLADLVKLFLEHGASLTIEDEQFHGTPSGWFGHGARNCDNPHGDYAEVARLLIAAGASIPAVDLPTGKSEVDAVLQQHGLIP
ncbi:MAG TPA: ankyrin repeat domain-containing protein [Candidatus Dormibacteraeota bacterium]|nr:ankyrin repeat domain-containing protein [Candidatus Dormibacteraeota bacterium]